MRDKCRQLQKIYLNKLCFLSLHSSFLDFNIIMNHIYGLYLYKYIYFHDKHNVIHHVCMNYFHYIHLTNFVFFKYINVLYLYFLTFFSNELCVWWSDGRYRAAGPYICIYIHGPCLCSSGTAGSICARASTIRMDICVYKCMHIYT